MSPEWILSLQLLSKHHFNSKHLLGVLNWHLLRCGIMHKHLFINLSPLTVPLFIRHLLLHSNLLVSSSPCLLNVSSPPCFCWDCTTYSHECICVILPMQLRQTYLSILGWGGGCNGPSSIKRRMTSKRGGERGGGWMALRK